MSANRMVIFDLDEDLKKLINSDEYKLQSDNPSSATVFDPSAFKFSKDDLNVSDYSLTCDKLEEYALVAI